MKCAAIILVMLGLLASPQHAAAFDSFSGKPVESRDWSQLCVQKDADYFAGNADSDSPFARCAKTSEAAANSCQRQCLQEMSDCAAVASRAGNGPNICFDYAATCMSHCKSE